MPGFSVAASENVVFGLQQGEKYFHVSQKEPIWLIINNPTFKE